MKTIFVLARNAFQEMVRERTIAVLFFGAVILLVLSSFVGTLSFDEQRRILIDLGFGAVHLSCLAIVFFKGSFLIQREIERQTCLMVLSRPISRFQFLLGQFFAVILLLIIHLALQGIMLAALLGFQMNFGRFLIVLGGIFVEMAVILSFVLLVTQWVRPIIGLLAGLGLFLVGNWLEEMKFFADKSKDESVILTATVIRWAFPNLFLLNYRSEGFLLNGLEGVSFAASAGHFLLWITVFMMFASFSFSKRDLV